MPIVVRNIRLGLDEAEELLVHRAAKRLGVDAEAVRTYAIVGRSVDARRGEVSFCYHLELALDEPLQKQRQRLSKIRPSSAAWIEPTELREPKPGKGALPHRPIVVGFGPGGMFAALRLAEFGYQPLVLERGRDVRRRHRDIMQRFYRDGDFDESSNLLFGEGGAGTYSDGKLYTRVNDPRCRSVLETLYRYGADPDILVDARPHIGSDRLPTICAAIRKRIQSLGGEIRFETRLVDLSIRAGRVESVELEGADPNSRTTLSPIGPMILAIGHSARDTLRMLAGRGVTIDSKPFQIGVRIEHPQGMIDRQQYGTAAGHRRLTPAEYHLVAKGAAGQHGDMFSFCMCPGGVILPSNESPGLVVTNGASRAKRSSPFGNSGLVITLDPKELGLSALDGLAFQEKWERLAFAATRGTYQVPMQRASDYLKKRRSSGTLETSYPLGGSWCDVRTLIPPEVATALDRALPLLDKKFPAFAGDEGLIAAPETRASAPVRITRDKESRQALDVRGLYPVGEGAGYAGGIISAAVDGLAGADAIIEHYAPPG